VRLIKSADATTMQGDAKRRKEGPRFSCFLLFGNEHVIFQIFDIINKFNFAEEGERERDVERGDVSYYV